MLGTVQKLIRHMAVVKNAFKTFTNLTFARFKLVKPCRLPFRNFQAFLLFCVHVSVQKWIQRTPKGLETLS